VPIPSGDARFDDLVTALRTQITEHALLAPSVLRVGRQPGGNGAIRTNTGAAHGDAGVGLENRFGGNPDVGSNPTPSAPTSKGVS